MKKIGGKKFNRSTWQWEYEPVRYVEFHCTPDEWNSLGNSKYLLVRDYLRSIDLNDLAWKDLNVKDIIDLAVGDIICKRYVVNIEEKKEWLFCSTQVAWEIDVVGAPYYVYMNGIVGSSGCRYAPWLYEPINIRSEYTERVMISVVAGVCNAVFGLIASVRSKGKYYEKYISGEYKICVGFPNIEKIKL